ncbi:5-oxoprolinase subunit B family protein [Teredinibacter turnerae]|uniref:5-oxoprolinase subunit B family protein n=1 Tax=Teredinibacter turnerae TaxID=2426 RepID=UPI000418BCFC|nr:allophanate hydrolase subunit 1 [Teredinibacter turnerae]
MYKLEPIAANSAIVYITSPDPITATGVIQRLAAHLDRTFADQLTDYVPANRSLLLQFDSPQNCRLQALNAAISQFLDHADETLDTVSRLHEVPVLYDGEDLDPVAQQTGLSVNEIIELHSGPVYTVVAVGFLPGFAYLSGLHKSLRLPRQITPRARVPQGSLAIAEEYSGVYPQASPGGWHLLGRVPVPLVFPFTDLKPGESPNRFAVGDKVKFRAITGADYAALGGRRCE